MAAIALGQGSGGGSGGGLQAQAKEDEDEDEAKEGDEQGERRASLLILLDRIPPANLRAREGETTLVGRRRRGRRAGQKTGLVLDRLPPPNEK